jgi:hypothetical protein
VVGRVSAAAEAVIGTPQTLSIVLGAVLVFVIDYRVLFVVMAVVMAGVFAYLWVGRSMTPVGTPSAGTGPADSSPADVSSAGTGSGHVPQARQPLLDLDDRGVGQR